MPHRYALLAASAAAISLSTPAMAQDDRYAGVPDIEDALPLGPLDQGHHGGGHHGGGHHGDGHGDGHGQYDSADGSYDGEWQGRWDDEETWHGRWDGTYTDAEGRTIEAEYHGVWMGESRFISEDGHVLSHDGRGWREHRSRGGHHGRRGGHGRGGHGPRLAYSTEERNQWLSECQYLMSEPYYDDYNRGGGNGGLVGGLLGAVVGGVAGNRIADDDRLLGTVVGAGLGGLAGAAIGSVLDGDGDGEINRHELWAARYCEAYLQRYEASGAMAYAQPMMMVPVNYAPTRRRSRDCSSCGGETVIVEEWVEIEERPQPRPRPRPAPRPQGSKLTPID